MEESEGTKRLRLHRSRVEAFLEQQSSCFTEIHRQSGGITLGHGLYLTIPFYISGTGMDKLLDNILDAWQDFYTPPLWIYFSSFRF